ncbi:MAG: MucR family transcriptional regulator [Rhizomicrobium sp.]
MSHSDRSLRLVARIVAAYVRSNALTAEDLEPLIKSVHASLRALGAPPKSDATADQARAILIRKSVTKDFIICLEDGKKLRRLKRYLRSRYQLTPEAYRAKWGLPPDYPMVAQSYAALRSQYAKKAGLGRVAEPARRRRKA